MSADARPGAAGEDIAIVGLGLRLPGAETLREFAGHLVAGRSLISEVPPERWSRERWFGSPRRGAEKTNSVWGGFVEGADRFDAAFFSVSPREAESMDPQQRFALELAWQAVEDAGYRAGDLAGTNTGVFMGVCHADYPELMERDGARTDAYFPTGTAYSIISNRVSYFLDLQGPSITNDTACSSSLVAVHEAVSALRNGECGLALAGGVNLCWSPKHFVAFSQAGMLSPTGRCRAFDQGADGYVRGEGGAVLLLKPLARALADGDAVHAVVKGAATNHGGRTGSLTVTNPIAQANLVEGLYTRAGIRPETVSYIEAHGPGTPVGDPIEVLALKRAFHSLHRAQGTVPEPGATGIGSVKTNIGHLEGAAGVAGMLKVVAAFAGRTLPATVGFSERNKLIDLDGSPFRIVRDTQPWPEPPAGPDGARVPRRAGVSSFGFGGTNAHVVLEEHLPADRPERAPRHRGPHVVPLSARTPERLREVARRLHAFLEPPAGEDLADLAYTLREGRESMTARVAFLVTDPTRLRTALAAFADGALPEGAVHDVTGPEAEGPDAGIGPVAARWVAGEDVDWSALPGHDEGRRVHLPTYPFARERHWFRPRPAGEAGPAAPAVGPAHPLVHRNTSTLAEQRHSSVFTGDEPFLDAHRVEGARVLPAAAQVEMVRAAVSYATRPEDHSGTGIRVTDTTWPRPVVVDGRLVELHVVITARPDGTLGHEIRSEPEDGPPVVHSRGTASVLPPASGGTPEVLDLDALRAACDTAHDPAQAYAAFRRAGLAYGPAMRGLDEIRLGSGELLARIRRSGADAAVALPPSVLDAAFQATLLLRSGAEAGAEAAGLALPLALDRLDVSGPCEEVMWAWVRRRTGGKGFDTFDLDLCDDTGTVRVALRGLTQRTVAASSDAPAPVPGAGPRVVAAAPRWVAAPVGEAGGPVTVHAFLADGPGPSPAALREAAGIGFTPLPAVRPRSLAQDVDAVLGLVLGRVREVLGSKPRGTHRFLVLVDERTPRHFHAALVGLFSTLHLEHPALAGRVVRVGGLADADAGRVAELVRREAADPVVTDCEVRLAPDGTRRVRRPVDLARDPGPRVPALREGGVYWVTGGLGGLGRHVARYFARCPGVTVVLSGRRAAGEETAGALAELRAAGVDAHYLAVDLGSARDVTRAVEAITREHGAPCGVVHAAGTLRDAYLLTKDPGDAVEVLRPKVSGALHLDAATRDLDLDFFVLFSSVAGFYGGAGQGDYAAANAFLDAFARHRRALVDSGERAGRTVSVGWPLWADGGMTVDAVTRAATARERGWEPLPTEDGLRFLGGVLLDAPEHVVLAYGSDPSLVPERRGVPAPPAPRPAGDPGPSGTTVDPPGDERLTAYATELLRTVLGEVLHHDPAALGTNVGLVEYGIDSIGILEATERLSDVFGPLPKTLFFEYVDIEGVVGHLVAEYRPALESRLGAGTPPPVTARESGPEPGGEPEPEPSVAEPAALEPAVPEPAVPEPARAGRGVSEDRHDIAIVGVSGRYPGADTLDELWEVLAGGRHLFEPVPRRRWDHDAVLSPDREVPGKSAIRTGTFLREIDTFDPRYFRVSQREAERMSPEVRLFLQVGVEALEDAGYSRETIQRRYDGDVGVLVGTMSNHYGLYGFQNALTRGAPATGSYTATIPNMLSYFYGFTGPSIFLDTMCSGSSTCIHQAVQMLRAGECRMVVAGGVNLLLHPYNLITSSHEHFTTATSDVIRSFGLGADGTILGEGVGAVVLKPLVDAERDGDRIHGVIKGTALSNAGVRNGFTVPNPRMQARAVRKALADSGVDPRTIGYVEGHGSGTSLGDPIEVRALTTAFAEHTSDTGFCALGSVKSNLGHLLHAAGVLGLTKVLLQLRERTLAPSLHSGELNPDIAFASTPFRVQREPAAWEPVTTTVDGVRTVHPRRAGLTSIGAGGMNSHIVIEEYVPGVGSGSGGEERTELFVFSAMTDEALTAVLTRFRSFLAASEEVDLPAVAHTLRVGKNELPRRWAFLARGREAVLRAVDRRLAGDLDQAAALADPDAPAPAADEPAARDLALAWTGGRSVDWAPLSGARPPRRVSLPAYPFARVRCWTEPEPGAPSVIAPLALSTKPHPFLGANHSDVAGVRHVLDVHLADLADYGCRQDKVRGIVPTFVIDLALAVAKVSGFAGAPRVSDLRSYGPVPWAETVRLVTTLTPVGGDAAEGLVSREDADGARTPVAEFTVRSDAGRPPAVVPVEDLDAGGSDRDTTRVLDREGVLAELAEGGSTPDPLSFGILGARRPSAGRLVLAVGVPELRHDPTARGIGIAPHVLAAVAHGVHLVAKGHGESDWWRSFPHTIGEVRVHDPAHEADDVAHVVLDLPARAGADGGRIRLTDRTGRVLVELLGVRWGPGDTVPARPARVAEQTAPTEPAREPAGEPAREPGEDAGLVAFAAEELRVLAAGLLKFDAAELDAHTGFDAFGFDSISLVAFAKLVKESFAIDLTPAVFFDVTTLGALAAHLVAGSADRVRALRTARAGAGAEQAPPAGTAVAGPSRSAWEAPGAERAGGPVPVAVIGAAGRFPGAPDLDAYWSRLVDGEDCVSAFPVHRYGEGYARIVREADFPHHAGVLDEVDAFDASFFRILPREAELMDPQHRIALEAVWSAVEDSGHAPTGLPRNTGVFLGVSGTDYAHLLTAHGVAPDAFTATGNAHSMLVNRISYLLDLRGPSQPVDTACSSSLVAVHRAVEAVRSGTCDLAIAGGVNLLLGVDTFVSAHRAGMLSPTGRCRTFARDADGYVRGEGVGVVVLKPLDAAERDGDPILGVLVGSAENHGGRANSLTAPNADAQAELVAAAMRGVPADGVDYVEAHGTGTVLGDPVEVRALRSAFSRLGAGARADVALGSVKTNIGHLEAAAGIAGLLKVLLALRHGVLPASLHCAEPNPYLELDGGPFRLLRENEPWRGHEDGSPRRAGVSSFGFGGTNCHVVVEEYRATAPDGAAGREQGPARVVVPLSARTPERLRVLARAMLDRLESGGTPPALPSLAWTLQSGREAMRERVGWVVGSHRELVDRLRAFTGDTDELGDGCRGTVTRPANPAPVHPDGDPARALADWVEGVTVDWRALYGGSAPRRVHLPTYPFARERFWIPEPDGPRPQAAAEPAPAALSPRTSLLLPRWTPAAAPASGRPRGAAPDRRVVVLCGALAGARDAVRRRVPQARCLTVETDRRRIENRFEDVSRQVFEIVRELVTTAAGRTLVQVVAPAGGDDAVHTALAGLLRTATAEDPGLTARLLCLDPAGGPIPDGETVADLVARNADAEEDLVLHRDGVHRVRSWERVEPSATEDHGPPWRDGGVYLITGGAGGIGSAVASAVARDVAGPTLVLTGRSPRDARVDALLARLRAAGADARYARADVSRREEVRHLVRAVREESGGLHGIVHAAGVLRDAALDRKTPREWEEVLAPKVAGLVHLDHVVGPDPLEFLLVFSSGSAITGNPGQADYATANAFADAFADLRNARVATGERAGRTLSIAWPLWREGGMRLDEAGLARLRRSRGLVPMESADGMAALAHAWGLAVRGGRPGPGQVWVHHGDPAHLPAAPRPARTADPTPDPDPALATGPALVTGPSSGTVEDGHEGESLRLLTEVFARITGLPAGALAPDDPLHAAGLDSITVVQLTRELGRTHAEVPKTLFYEAPTLRAVAARLAAGGPARRPVLPRPTTTPPPPPHPVPAPHPTATATGRREPIAVIGMSGRYPGAPDLTAFWADLKAGRDRIREVPPDRWPLEGFHEPDRATAIATGRSYGKWGGFLDEFAAFDPLFFRIAPRDAYAMDPQERLFLQACWEVLEDAGHAPSEFAERQGHRVGVFAGVTKSGHGRYGARRLPSGEPVVPAVSFASVSARVSHVLDLRGPSLTLDTMCSASLTAIHEACEHLYRGSCEAAIAGGVNLYLHPLDYVELCRSTMLSTGPEPRSFGKGGDGFVPGEGVGAVLLKPLSRAVADGDRVLAVIRGSSVNHGGRTHGYTVPNPRAQAELIREALDRAGVSARDIGCVEAHGTGTELGDPIEIAGLKLAFARDTDDRGFCALGSVKSSIGHLEAAAGIAGLTKAVLQLRHRRLVPSLHAEEPNPDLDLERSPFFLQRTLADWPGDRPRLASVSSFGAGGSNAHVILEEHVPESDPGPLPASASVGASTGGAAEQLIVLSARTPGQLRAQAARLADHLDGAGAGVALPDLAFTLQVGREPLEERLAVVVSSVAELREVLRADPAGDSGAAPGVHRGTVPRAHGAPTRLAESGDLAELAALWTEGTAPDWDALHAPAAPRRISLPTYPFARDRYWAGDLEAVDTLAPDRPAVPASAGTPGPTPPVLDAVGGPGPALDERVGRLVRENLAAALAMDPAEIDGGRAFAEYGLDSILGVRFVHTLNEALSLDLTTSVVYDHSSADRLVTHLLDAHRDALTLPEPLTTPAPTFTSTPVPAPVPAFAPVRPAAGPREPIAVIGMSGRFAGSDSLDELWEHLARGHDLVGEATRWPLPDRDPAGNPLCTRGGFLNRIDEFDPLFFNVSGVEAAVMDPQQRLLLEESWKALEDAGHAGEALAGRTCGVYVGCWEGDYRRLIDEDAPAQAFWGNLASVIPGRIAYFLDLKGPAIAVDTSCSSSLVAIDLACKDLWSGETDTALAGGVYLQTGPRLYELAGRAGMLSPTGRCRSFDRRADGFVPGEGVGVLVLKRLSDALADGDHVHGVIRASGTNHDGATNGVTAPSSLSQERLLSTVHERFGVDVETVQVVEAHGTGTRLGDPIEFQALTRAFRKGTRKSGYCALGSVKTNLGHTQYAAGVAGVIKLLLGLRHRRIPASLHFEQANEAIEFEGSPFYPSTRTHPWPAPAGGGPRRGAVSSFGASGTNAHLVVEEAPALPAPRTPRPSPAPRLIVLSARSREQLAQQLARLAAHCRRDGTLDHGDVGHTLAVGRAHFPHRYACVVHDLDDLVRVLEQGLDGPRAHTGEAGTSGSSDPADHARPDDLSDLAERFVRGARIEFARVLPGPEQGLRRVPLPPYPFARESHWATPTPPPPAAPLPPAAETETETSDHPVPTGTALVPDGSGAVRGVARLAGDESFLRDHVVRGRRVLPGVVHLELAREVVVRALDADPAAPFTMRDVTWVRPLVLDGPAREVEVVARPAGAGAGFTIGSPSDAAGPYCEGRVLPAGAARPDPVDLAALRTACPRRVAGARITETLVAAGIEHGPTLRAVEEAYVGPGTVVARLNAPEGAASFVLPPALLDSAIQASAALSAEGEAAGDAAVGRAVLVPFALDELTVLGPCAPRMWAVVRAADGRGPGSGLGRLDIDLVTDAGEVRIRMVGYTSRAVPEPVPSLFAPVWEPVRTAVNGTASNGTRPDGTGPDVSGPSSGDRVLVVGASDARFAEIARTHPRALAWTPSPTADPAERAAALRSLGPIDHLVWIAPDTAPRALDGDGFGGALEGGVIAAFRTVKALLATGHETRPLGVTLVTRGALPGRADEAPRPAQAALHGLFGSLEQEYGHWTVRRVDLDDSGDGVAFADLPARTPGGPWVRRSGQWLTRRLAPCVTAPAATAPYREGGVYVVVGGAGGLGEAWTRHVVDRHGARVVWLGRRPSDPDIEARLRAVRGRGEVSYLTADATDPEALRAAREEIVARYGRIHGVVHCALVLRDRSLAGMSEAEFRAALAAKADTSVAMARVFAREPLDFALFFSSLQSFTPAAGQANYAAGCAFADSYAHLMAEELGCPVKVMNWGWWGSIGSVSSPFHRRGMARWGLESIEPPEAMAALDTLLTGPQPHLGFVRLSDPAALAPVDPTLRTTVYGRAAHRVPAAAVTAAADAPEADDRLLRATAEWRRAERDPLLGRLLRAHLEDLGAVRPGDPRGTGADAPRDPRARAGIAERYTAWLAHSLRVMPDEAPPLEVLRREWARRCAQWSTDPDKAAELGLVDATLRALPAVLTGRVPATDVLFPRGSVELVEGCYRDNRVADAFNRTLAAAASGIVAERLRRAPGARIRILEIGAGTGGTSVGLFAALRPFGDAIETYTYTDLSKAFLDRARSRFGPEVPALDCRRFDVERPLADQGIGQGHYDLVVAANVLHATRDIRATLRNAKAALRDKGWLLLNELTAFDVFSHLTFGLLEGWWLAEDGALRVPGSPALAPEAWRDVLRDEGFSPVLTLLPRARELGQQIIAAEGDGVARQRVPARTPAAPRAGVPTVPVRKPVEVPVQVPVQSPVQSPVRAAPVQAAPVPVPVAVPEPSAPTPGVTAVAALSDHLVETAARILRIPVEKIDPATPLTAYGMDSILVLQFTNALRRDLGELSSTLLFEQDSIARLVDHLLADRPEAVTALVGPGPSQPLPDPPGPVPPSPPAPGPVHRPVDEANVPTPTIGTLFTEAMTAGRPDLAGSLLRAAARMRPGFTARPAGLAPDLLHLAEGTEGTALVCLPSLIAPTGVHQYLRFAMALRGLRSVWAGDMPGYAADEPLPRTLPAAVDVWVAALRERFPERPFAMVAYSSGGWPAHEIVRRLEADGTPPAALVLLDSPARARAGLSADMSTITRRLVETHPRLPLDDEQLTAMARYAELFDGWRPLPVATPTLFVGAAAPGPLREVLGEDAEPLWRPDWEVEHTRVEAPGNHFSLLEEHAESTAHTVHQWLLHPARP
ncbi:SDR family NAD(P)-dependent oxidoreductase (plasmid) [Streptomyces sp. BI20]|uniref:SDR family NAD(P)-dependent oxidoreductase n=1 Tax=Streptomyces sp. BI20 TaxID=3403460 RepID=UPI003C70F0F1